jgi:hypothetical protein
MLTYFRTAQPEQAAQTLCKKHRLVVALQWLVLPKRMPLRQSEIKGVQIYHVRAKSKADAEVRAWHKTGGLYIREYYGRADFGHADAILRVEAPLSMSELETDSLSAAELFVICSPLTWNPHRNALIECFPPAEVARRFWQTVEIYRQKKPRNIDLAMLKMMELPEAGTICVPKTEFYKKANISSYQMNYIGATSNLAKDRQRAGHYCTLVTLRFEPETPQHKALYHWIEANCAKYMQYHVIKNGEPGADFPQWKSMLRMMHYAQYVQREDEINFWMLSGMKPDFEVYDKRYATAQAELEEVIKFVEALPELPLLSTSTRSAPRSAAPESP